MADRLKLPLTGGCQCGKLHYSVKAQPTTLYCCHCTECQAQSSSAFGMSLRVPSGAVELEGGSAGFFRDQDSDTAVECVFCPNCGARIIHRGRGSDSGDSLKAGTLNDKSWLNPAGHIWTSSAQKWVKLEGLIYEKQPDDGYAALEEAFAQQFS